MDEKPTPTSFVIAAFTIDSEKSLLYGKRKTISGLKNAVERAVEKGADYISLRIIRKEVK